MKTASIISGRLGEKDKTTEIHTPDSAPLQHIHSTAQFEQKVDKLQACGQQSDLLQGAGGSGLEQEILTIAPRALSELHCGPRLSVRLSEVRWIINVK